MFITAHRRCLCYFHYKAKYILLLLQAMDTVSKVLNENKSSILILHAVFSPLIEMFQQSEKCLLKRKTFTDSLETKHNHKGPPTLDNLWWNVHHFCYPESILNYGLKNNVRGEGPSIYIITVSCWSGTINTIMSQLHGNRKFVIVVIFILHLTNNLPSCHFCCRDGEVVCCLAIFLWMAIARFQ